MNALLTDEPMDKAYYREARTHLKMTKNTLE